MPSSGCADRPLGISSRRARTKTGSTSSDTSRSRRCRDSVDRKAALPHTQAQCESSSLEPTSALFASSCRKRSARKWRRQSLPILAVHRCSVEPGDLLGGESPSQPRPARGNAERGAWSEATCLRHGRHPRCLGDSLASAVCSHHTGTWLRFGRKDRRSSPSRSRTTINSSGLP